MFHIVNPAVYFALTMCKAHCECEVHCGKTPPMFYVKRPVTRAPIPLICSNKTFSPVRPRIYRRTSGSVSPVPTSIHCPPRYCYRALRLTHPSRKRHKLFLKPPSPGTQAQRPRRLYHDTPQHPAPAAPDMPIPHGIPGTVKYLPFRTGPVPLIRRIKDTASPIKHKFCTDLFG
jgi:hypothetical protein